MPALSSASQLTSSRSRCCGSIPTASRGEMPKCIGSKRSTRFSSAARRAAWGKELLRSMPEKRLSTSLPTADRCASRSLHIHRRHFHRQECGNRCPQWRSARRDPPLIPEYGPLPVRVREMPVSKGERRSAFAEFQDFAHRLLSRSVRSLSTSSSDIVSSCSAVTCPCLALGTLARRSSEAFNGSGFSVCDPASAANARTSSPTVPVSKAMVEGIVMPNPSLFDNFTAQFKSNQRIHSRSLRRSRSVMVVRADIQLKDSADRLSYHLGDSLIPFFLRESQQFLRNQVVLLFGKRKSVLRCPSICCEVEAC